MALNSNPDYNEWMEIYKKLIFGNLRWKRVIVRKWKYF
jgi:hypothetical protein